MTAATPSRDRLMELLCDRATVGLTEREEAEVDRLLGEHRDIDPLSFDLAAAAADLSWAAGDFEPMPESLERRVLTVLQESAAAEDRQGERKKESPDLHLRPAPSGPASYEAGEARPPAGGTLPILSWTGWLAAAAAIVFAVFVWNTSMGVAVPAAQERLAAFLSQPPTDLVRVEWAAQDDPAAQGASGEIFWSTLEQRGFMKISGLEPNDPTRNQYQLWIFDPEHKHPVDGGVFNIPPGESEAVIPVTPPIRVHDTTLFAVTVEKPGGVVVSDQERIVLAAPVTKG